MAALPDPVDVRTSGSGSASIVKTWLLTYVLFKMAALPDPDARASTGSGSAAILNNT